QTPSESPFLSLERGLGSLIQALVARLPDGVLRCSTPVERVIAPQGEDGTRVIVGGESIRARHVVVAGPPWAALALVGDLDERLRSALSEVRGFATATVFFGLDRVRAQHDFVGSGFIVPPGEADILASTFISSKWEGRAPEGKVLVRAFVGGGRKDIRSSDDEQLRDVALGELTRLLGDLGPIQFSRVHRYARGTPQPELGYGQVLERIRGAVAERPWLSL